MIVLSFNSLTSWPINLLLLPCVPLPWIQQSQRMIRTPAFFYYFQQSILLLELCRKFLEVFFIFMQFHTSVHATDTWISSDLCRSINAFFSSLSSFIYKVFLPYLSKRTNTSSCVFVFACIRCLRHSTEDAID